MVVGPSQVMAVQSGVQHWAVRPKQPVKPGAVSPTSWALVRLAAAGFLPSYLVCFSYVPLLGGGKVLLWPTPYVDWGWDGVEGHVCGLSGLDTVPHQKKGWDYACPLHFVYFGAAPGRASSRLLQLL